MSIGRSISKGKRVWVISSVDARVDRLVEIHNLIESNYRSGDALVYTGNIFGGVTGKVTQTIDEILDFRKHIMAVYETESDDVCYIRGAYEDMLFKLFSLNFDSKPVERYMYMVENGFEHTLKSYGIDPKTGTEAAKQGSVQLLNFIENLKAEIKRHEGHADLLFSKSLVNYVYTENKTLLILSAGFDRNKPLNNQREEFAYGVPDTSFCVKEKYDDYENVVRGNAYDIVNDGIFVDPGYVTISPKTSLYAMLFDGSGHPDMMIKV